MPAISTLVADRARSLWTGSPAADAHEHTDADLEHLLKQEPHDRLMGGYRTYTLRELQSAARVELAWRREHNLTFGWSHR